VTVPRPAFGVALPLHEPLDALVASACDAEALGYTYLWATDDRLQKDVFVVLAAIALEIGRASCRERV